jgi:hypothetical protein
MLRMVVARLLESAVQRWPAHQRDELAREWDAELYTLDHDAGVVAPVRRWRQLRFAGSLALARPPGADPVSLYWLRQASPAGAHATWLVFAPLLTMLTAVAALVPLLFIPFGAVPYTPTSMALFSIENYTVEAGLAMLIGTARRRGRLCMGDAAGDRRPAGR